MVTKTVELSSDGGTIYNKLPGSVGAFNIDGEAIEDTVFGQDYQSQDTGLLTWAMSANAFFKGFPGYKAKIKKIGATTGMTTEATTLVSGKTYQIDDVAKRVLDRDVAIVIWDVSSPVDAADILSFDYLFGRVTFTGSYSVTGDITFNSASYFPLVVIGKSNSYTLTMTKNAKDISDFPTVQGNDGYRTFDHGLRTVQLELGGIFDATEDLAQDVEDRTELIIEIDAAGDGSSLARGFFKFSGTGQSGDVGATEESSLTAMLIVPDVSLMEFPFQWQHISTTLNVAIEDALTSWLTDSALKAQYLPQGSTGQSPLDGKEGDVIITDISMSGGLSDMNTFSVDLQGTGAVTTV